MCMRGCEGVRPRGPVLVNRATRWLGPTGLNPSRLRPSACALRLPVLLAGSELFAQNVCRYFGGERVQSMGPSSAGIFKGALGPTVIAKKTADLCIKLIGLYHSDSLDMIAFGSPPKLWSA
jgi:hypothetical protein